MAPERDAIHLQLVRGRVGHALQHPVGDFRTEAAVGALLALVGQHRHELHRHAVDAIGPDDLAQRVAVGAVTVLQVRAVVVDHLEAQRQHRAVALERELAAVDAVRAVVVAAHGVVEPVLHELHRPAAGASERCRQRDDLVGEELAAETPAGGHRDEVELVRRHAERGAHQPADVVEKRAVGVDVELAGAGLVVGHRADRLERLPAGAGPMELALDHDVGLGKIRVHGTERVRVAVREIGRPALRVQHRVAGSVHRNLRIDHDRQVLVLHVDEVAGVLGDVSRLGDHRGHRLADVTHAIHGDAVLHHRRACELRGRTGHLLGFLARHHQQHARQRTRLRHVDPLDARMRPVRAQHRGVSHVRELHVVDVAALAGEQARVLHPLHVLADPLVAACGRLALLARRNIAFGGDVLGDVRRAHACASFIFATAACTASTML